MDHVHPSPFNRRSSKVAGFSVLAIFRNESHILQEWLNHYLLFGAERIYLIDNNSNDDYFPILKPYMESGVVELYHCAKDGYQVGAYSEMLPLLSKGTTWVGTFDLDEFIYPTREDSIPSVINKFSEYEAVLIPWLSFGSNGHLTQPSCVIDGFISRGRVNTDRAFLKAICRPESIVRFTQHNPTTRNRKKVLSNGREFDYVSFVNLQEDEIGDFELLNNHYRLQSLEYFTRIKTNRPEVNERVADKTKASSFFEENDGRWSQLIDTRLLSIYAKLRARNSLSTQIIRGNNTDEAASPFVQRITG